MLAAVMDPADKATLDQGRNNNFNLIRILAATGVLISHAFPLSLGPGADDPFSAWLGGTSLGTICVLVFFAISGYFITKSFDQRRSVPAFLRARALRLFPALIVVALVSVIVAGLFLTSASPAEFWPAALTFVLRDVTLFHLQNNLPGVFIANPYGPAINGSLWTLGHEVTAYLCVLLAGWSRIFRRNQVFWLSTAAFLVLYGWKVELPLKGRFEELCYLGLPFLFGAILYRWRGVIRLSAPIALILIFTATLARETGLFSPVLALTLAYVTIWLGFLPTAILGQYNRLGDYSYGTYLYAFPVQQLGASLGFVTPGSNMQFALPIALCCAAVSWHCIEGPALRLRHKRPTP